MRFAHPAAPGRAVRLAYGTNFGEPADLGELFALADAALVPLRARLGLGGPLGIGLYVPASLALALDAAPAEAERLARELAARSLEVVTWNAFPYGGFHRPGLKSGVFAPGWADPARLEYTLAVARLAARCAPRGAAHVSISTHTGRYGPYGRDGIEKKQVAKQLLSAAHALARIEAAGGPRIVLALEPEPGASAPDTTELAALFEHLRAQGPDYWAKMARNELHGVAGTPAEVLALVARHLGACLDACHAACEFEAPARALANALAGGTPLGKLQFSSAVALSAPGRDEAGRRALFALDEPVFLHQVMGRASAAGRVRNMRAADLGELRAAFEKRAGAWHECDEWRVHFHVPVDLEALPGTNLGTTRALADELLAAALAAPQSWGSGELEVEIETYTWDVLDARGAAAASGADHPARLARRLDGMEREMRHVIARIEAAGWRLES